MTFDLVDNIVRVLLCYLFNLNMSFDWSINLFAFKTIIDRYVFIVILLFIFLVFLLFLIRPFNISYNNGLVVMNSFSFFLPRKLFICSLIINDYFSG